MCHTSRAIEDDVAKHLENCGKICFSLHVHDFAQIATQLLGYGSIGLNDVG